MGAIISITETINWNVAPASWRGLVDFLEKIQFCNHTLRDACSSVELAKRLKFLSFEEVDLEGTRELIKLIENLDSQSPAIAQGWHDPSYLEKFRHDLGHLIEVLLTKERQLALDP
jgi:hypothetical protein